MSKRKLKSEWQLESDKIHNCEFEILDNMLSAHDKVSVLHKKCGNILKISMHNHTKRYCIYCSKKNKKTKDEWQLESDKIHNFQFKILDEPNNGKIHCEILHKKCNRIIKMTMNNHINHKNGCRLCGKNSPKLHEYWIAKSKELFGEDYNIIDKVETVNKKVKILHNICGREHYKNMNSFIHVKRGCPHCQENKKYAENYIESQLNLLDIVYEKQKTFNDLKNDLTSRHLFIDFWLPAINVGIEVNGLQHYVPIKHWGGDEEFKSQVHRDNTKRIFFIKNNFKLIELNNKKLTKIITILDEYGYNNKRKEGF